MGYTDAERQQAEKALQESELRYRLLAENIRDVIWTMNLDGHFTYVSPSVFQLRGYTAEEVMKQSIQEAFTADSALQVLGGIQILLSEDEEQTLSTNWDLQQPCKDGRTVWTEVNVSIIRDSKGLAQAVLGLSRDITDRKIAEETIAFQAFHDQLTHLPNQRLFKDRLEMTIIHAKRYNSMVGVMFIDLDRFKAIGNWSAKALFLHTFAT